MKDVQLSDISRASYFVHDFYARKSVHETDLASLSSKSYH